MSDNKLAYLIVGLVHIAGVIAFTILTLHGYWGQAIVIALIASCTGTKRG